MSLFRLQSRGGRFYADLQKYGGPSLKAMVPDGEHRATKDEEIAADLYQRWKKYYLDHKRRRHLGLSQNVPFGKFAAKYLEDRSELDEVKGVTLEYYGGLLDRVLLPFFKPHTGLGSITTARVREFVKWRLRQKNGRKDGGRISPVTVQKELALLSSILDHAIRDEVIFENPVRQLPSIGVQKEEVRVLSPAEAWALLEAAAKDQYYPYARALLGVYLYGGLRRDEGRGLEARDIDRAAKVIRVRDNRFRGYEAGGIKHRASLRDVPLWPDVAGWLPARIGSAPLFPSLRKRDQELSVYGVTKVLGRAIERSKIGRHATPHTLRHTACAMRLQTLDNGAPVAEYTVVREFGWSTPAMLYRVYGHLPPPEQRMRLPVLTYRPEQVRTAGNL